jgi:hypothetical protein
MYHGPATSIMETIHADIVVESDGHNKVNVSGNERGGGTNNTNSWIVFSIILKLQAISRRTST